MRIYRRWRWQTFTATDPLHLSLGHVHITLCCIISFYTLLRMLHTNFFSFNFDWPTRTSSADKNDRQTCSTGSRPVERLVSFICRHLNIPFTSRREVGVTLRNTEKKLAVTSSALKSIFTDNDQERLMKKERDWLLAAALGTYDYEVRPRWLGYYCRLLCEHYDRLGKYSPTST